MKETNELIDKVKFITKLYSDGIITRKTYNLVKREIIDYYISLENNEDYLPF